jgi:outer membrane protein assembly complex protein YaeT
VKLQLIFAILIALNGLRAFAAPVLRDITPKDEARLKKELPQLFTADPEMWVYDEAIRVLMSQGQYENVFIEKKGDKFEVIGKPLRLVEAIVFTGVAGVREEDLRELLEFKTGDRFDRKKAVAAAERIKAFYADQGYYNAIVELGFNKTESKNIRLNIDIKENAPCRIKSLVFHTANVDLKNKLNSRFKKMINRVLTTDRARRLLNDLNSFLIDNRYLATEVPPPEDKYNEAKTEASITIEIREPYRWEFYFEGNNFETLRDIYRAMDLENRERKNLDPAGEGAERLRREYLARGFANISIETKVVNPKDTYLKRVYYTINEGPRVRIKNIEIQGRISRVPKYYKDFILKNSSELVSDGYYNRQDLENGFKNLTTELRNQGFLRARILSSRVEYNDKRNEATAYVMIDEGGQTQIRALDFEGNHFFSSFELAGVTGLETNTALRLGDFEASMTKLKDFYHNQGFLEMKLLNENEDIIQYNDKGTQARIVYKIFEGPRIRVNAIAVEGNTFTKTRVILKETDFKLGEVLTPQKIDEAISRLNSMGLFNRADVHTLEEGSNVSQRTVVISVTERDPGTFRFGGGVNNERNLTLRGFTGISYNNLWGTGRGISGRAELKQNVAIVNYPEHEITVGYYEPFLLGTRTRGRVNLTRSEQVFYYSKTSKVVPLTTSNRIDFLAEREFNRNARLTWKLYSLESRKDWERDGKCITEKGKPCEAGQSNYANTLQVASIGPTLDFDYRDNAFNPTRGSLIRFTGDYSNPNLGSSEGVEFFKLDGNFTRLTPIGKTRVVWANSFRAGYLKNLSDEPGSGVPANWSFILGGISTVRGFDSASDHERIPSTEIDGNGNHILFEVPRGNKKLVTSDSHYYLIKSELRFPIVGSHGGVIFYDGGLVQISGKQFFRPYRDAIGVGYRLNTPVGPVAADFAFKLDPERHGIFKEQIFRFHLSIGTF